MIIDTKKLRELAEAAPKDVLDYQRWRESFVAYLFKVHVDGSRSSVGSIDSESLAAFWCAANPQTAIALLDEIERLRAEVVKLGTSVPQEAIDAINMKAVDEALTLRSQLAAMTAARDEACDIADEAERMLPAHLSSPRNAARVRELRKVGQ